MSEETALRLACVIRRTAWGCLLLVCATVVCVHAIDGYFDARCTELDRYGAPTGHAVEVPPDPPDPPCCPDDGTPMLRIIPREGGGLRIIPAPEEDGRLFLRERKPCVWI